MTPRRQLTPGQRRMIGLQIIVAATVMLACVLGFVWVLLTREISFAGSFGLLGGHWAFAFIMPGLILSLIAVLHGAEQLARDGRVLPEETEEYEDEPLGSDQDGGRVDGELHGADDPESGPDNEAAEGDDGPGDRR